MKTITKWSLQKSILLVIVLLVQSFVFAQNVKETIATDENITVDNISCSAGDLRVQKLLLTDADGEPIIKSCQPGTSQAASISTILNGPTNGDRYSLTISYDVYIDGVDNGAIYKCLYEQEIIPTNEVFEIQEINYVCGSRIELRNFEILWNTSINKPCNKPNRCFESALGFSVSGPLLADFNNADSCSNLEMNFSDLTTGGKDATIDIQGNETVIPYVTHEWNFGDNSGVVTLAGQTDGSISHTYANPGTYTVSLKVTDAEGSSNTVTKQVEVYPLLNVQTLTAENESCAGEANGKITVSSVVGGSGGYTYSISPEPTGFSQNNNEFSNLPSGNYSITVEDSRSCSTSKSTVISIDDTTAPTIKAPTALDVSACNTGEIMADGSTFLPFSSTEKEITESQFTREGGSFSEINVASITYTDSTSGSCPIVVTRTFKITDNCGKSASSSQSLFLYDKVAPVLPTAPADISYQCDAQVPDAGQLTATDNCDGSITATGTDVVSNPSPNVKMITRTWNFTDSCNNKSSVSQIIKVEDTSKPVLPTAPADEAYQCIDEVPAPGQLTATDNCDGDIIVSGVDSINENDSCNILITRTWTFEDASGNSDSVAQIITVKDTTAPVAPDAPEDFAYQCISAVPSPGELSATDNCDGEIKATGVDTTDNSTPNVTVINRVWTFTDSCKNSTQISQTITVQDTNEPQLPQAPNDVTYQCMDEVPAPGELTATENCGSDITVTGVDSINSDDACNVIITRTWTFTDDSNNSDSVSQIITVKDSTSPVAPTAPANETFQCGDDVPQAGSLTAQDNCDGEIIAEGVDSVSNPSENITVITRTWTFTDSCKNSSSVSQTFIVQDTTNPDLPNAPQDETVQCMDDVEAAGQLTANDNCDGDITVTGVDSVNDENNCNIVITRTWSFEDASGNSDSVSQIITVSDTTAPITPTAPQDVSYECGAQVPVAGQLFATDNCDGQIEGISSDSTDNSNPNVTVITRTWTFTDSCNNSSSVSQTITIEDTTEPQLPAAPANETVQCMDDVETAGQLTAIDNCDGNITVTGSDSVNDDDSCNIIITRTWIFEDEAGNSDSISQTITVSDTTAPVVPTPPADESYQCGAQVPEAGQLFAVDNCDGQIEGISSDSTDNSDPNVTVITRTWTFTDSCNNSSSVSQTITVEDTTEPQLPAAPANETVQCMDEVEAAGQLTAIDNCDGNITVTGIDSVNDNDTCNIIITRTWTFEDEAGNSDSVSQIITVNDTTDPVAPDAPEDFAYQCISAVPAPGELIAIDNCDNEINATGVDTFNNSNPNITIITRTWTFTDSCNNSTEISQTITVQDTNEPQLPQAPNDITYQCMEDVPAPGELTATENCDADITVTGVDSVNNDDPCNIIITRTWTFTDSSDNTDSISQIITVSDTTAPEAPTAPTSESYQCSANVPDAGQLFATDNCGGQIEGVSQDVFDNSDSDATIITRTWTFTDDCNNSSSVSQTITVEDTIAPELPNVPQNETVQCIEDVVVAGELTANDNCDGPITVIGIDSTDSSDTCNVIITRTWTFEDAAGNSDSITQIITVNDTTGPTIETPAESIALECNASGDNGDLDAWLNSQGGAAASDNCGGAVTWSNNYGGGATDCDNAIEVTFTATDECGNTSSTTATYNVEDNTPPVIVNPASNMNFECDGLGNEADFQTFLNSNAGAEAQDDCSAITWSNVISPFTEGCGNTRYTKVTFIATDACGNSASTEAGFYIIDTTPPTITGVENVTVDCNDDVESAYNAWIANNGNAVASDSCSDIITWMVDESAAITEACGNAGVRTVSFTATDDCSNSNSVSATFTIEDNTPPVITTPAGNTNVECDGMGNEAEFQAFLDSNGGAEATDDCGDITWTFLEGPYTESCGNTRFVKVIFTATDSCGNSSDTEGGFFIIDTTPPSISGVESITVECGDDVESAYNDWISNNGNASATDDCSDIITWTIDDSAGMTDGCAETGVRTVVFTATDDCSNSASTTATFTIADTTPPVIETEASSVNAQCDVEGSENSLDTWLMNNGGATASDNCGTVTWSNDFGQTSVDDCSAAVTVTFTATDECGNSSTSSASYTVSDTEAPIIETQATGVTIECDGDDIDAQLEEFLNSNGGAEASDNCSAFTWSNDFKGLASNGCEGSEFVGTTTVTFTATDACGNSSSTSAAFTVEDNTPPTITTNAESVSVECDGSGNLEDFENYVAANGNAVASDSCSDVTWSSEIDLTSAGCGNTTLTKIRFIATDACGNSSETMSTFTIVDTTPPSITGATGATIECSDDTDAQVQAWIDNNGGATATDECSDSITWTVEASETEDACGATGSTAYTFTATDDCGNSASTTATLSIVDTTPPTFTVPDSMIVSCEEDLENIMLSGDVTDEADNCSTDLEATFEDSVSAGDCPNTRSIIRTWTLVDDCGNTTVQTQSISIVDETAPTFTVPGPMTLACQDDLEDLSLTGDVTDEMDNCSTGLEATYSDAISAGDCPSASSVIRTWTLVDECGNTTVQTQSISIVDETAPVLVGNLDTAVNVNCSDIPAMPSLVFEDSCTTNISVSFEETSTDQSEDTYTITRTWTVADECGNTANFVQTINVTNSATIITATSQVRCYEEGPFNLNDIFDAELPEGGTFSEASGTLDINGNLLSTDIDSQGTFNIEYNIEGSDAGCPTVYQLSLTVDDACVVLAPDCPEDASQLQISQAVTPNGDNINDFFEVGGFDPECNFIVEVMIFNRWGAKIYENNNYQNDWGADASNASIGNSNKVPTGTYYYIINIRNSGIAPINGPIYVGTK